MLRIAIGFVLGVAATSVYPTLTEDLGSAVVDGSRVAAEAVIEATEPSVTQKITDKVVDITAQ